MRLKRFNEALVSGKSPQERSIDLRGPSGNAYSILGMAKNLCNQLEEADPEKYEWKRIQSEMQDSDYNNLVKTFDVYFGDYVTIYNADVLEESLKDDFDELFKGRERRDYEKYIEETVKKILDSQVGVEKKLDGYEIKIVSDGHLKIHFDDKTVMDLYVESPEKWGKNERVSFFYPKSSGSHPLKISKTLAQKLYDKLIRFAEFQTNEEFKNPFKKKEVQIEPNLPIEDFSFGNTTKRQEPQEGYDLERFYSSIEKLNDKEQNTRKHEFSRTFFRDFIGKELMGSTVKDIIVDVIKNHDYHGMSIELENGTKIYYSFERKEDNPKEHIRIEPFYDSNQIWKDIQTNVEYNKRHAEHKNRIETIKKEGQKVSRRDARLISQITRKFNPNTLYKNGTGDLVIKEYESKKTITSFKDFINE